MWLIMLTPALIVGGIILAIVLLLTHGQRNALDPSVGSSPTPQALSSSSTLGTPSTPHPKKDVMGRVVLSLGSTLTDDERRVMDEMAKAGGEVLQSDLPRLTSFSKATVSKAIHGLEVRGIVLRERHKWTYWCRVNPRLVERVLQAETGPPEAPEKAA